MALLDIRNIDFKFANQSPFNGLKQITFQVNSGEIKVIIGESGCGKSTLLRSINGFYDLDNGQITLNGERVLGPAYNLIPGHTDIQYVSQDALLHDYHTVEENILDQLNGYSDLHKVKTVKHLIKILNLAGLEKQKAKFLSSGQKQRLTIARALAANPKLYLLDEPFTNLDYPTKRAIWQSIFSKVKNKGTSVILVTHLPEDVWEIADEVLVMDNGKIIQKGAIEQVYYHPKNKYVAQILGEYSLLPKSLLRSNYVGFSISKFHFLIRPQQISFNENKKGLKVCVKNRFKTVTQLVKYIALYDNKIELIFYSEKQFEIGEVIFVEIADSFIGK